MLTFMQAEPTLLSLETQGATTIRGSTVTTCLRREQAQQICSHNLLLVYDCWGELVDS